MKVVNAGHARPYRRATGRADRCGTSISTSTIHRRHHLPPSRARPFLKPSQQCVGDPTKRMRCGCTSMSSCFGSSIQKHWTLHFLARFRIPHRACTRASAALTCQINARAYTSVGTSGGTHCACGSADVHYETHNPAVHGVPPFRLLRPAHGRLRMGSGPRL